MLTHWLFLPEMGMGGDWGWRRGSSEVFTCMGATVATFTGFLMWLEAGGRRAYSTQQLWN